MSSLSVLIENKNAPVLAGGGGEHYALKAEDVAIQIARTPLQIPVPQHSPFLFDIGSYRPSITISGVVDDIDTDDSMTFDGGDGSKTYKVPTQFQLTTAATDWVHRATVQYLYILHSNYDSATVATKFFDKYECAIQQFRCQLQAGIETRWEYTIQFVTKSRMGDGSTDNAHGVGATNS
tara:strand:- start:1911 stop:2447 length:537 start_codon:yes stop_codon:yes gene_type:complete